MLLGRVAVVRRASDKLLISFHSWRQRDAIRSRDVWPIHLEAESLKMIKMKLDQVESLISCC